VIVRRSSPWLLLAIVACGTSSPPSPPTSCPGSDALWVASDYMSSAVGGMSTSGSVWSTTKVDLGADPTLAVSGGRAFYLARDEDKIFTLDPLCGTPSSELDVHQASHTGSSDPQSVAVASDGSLWVPLYDVPTLLVLSPSGTVLHTIDLSSYDSDGNPQAMGVAIVSTPAGEKAFVPLQRLDDTDQLMSNQPSWMLRVDIAAAKVETYVVLAGRNPFGMTEDESTGALWLAEPGNFDDATEPLAGIERFDTSTSTTALVTREADLGGSVAEVAVDGACGVAIVADATQVNATSLVTFNPTSGTPIATAARSPLSTSGFDLEGTAWLGADFFVGDRRRATDGYPIHDFAAGAACDLTPRPDVIFLPLPPVAVRPVP
jgi:hypothetical protein